LGDLPLSLHRCAEILIGLLDGVRARGSDGDVDRSTGGMYAIEGHVELPSPRTIPEEPPDSRIGPTLRAMAVHALEVDHEDVENDRVVCPTCGRPLWLADEPSMAVKLRDIELATTNRVVSVVITGPSPMIFATCTCGDSLQIAIRGLMPLPGPQR